MAKERRDEILHFFRRVPRVLQASVSVQEHEVDVVEALEGLESVHRFADIVAGEVELLAGDPDGLVEEQEIRDDRGRRQGVVGDLLGKKAATPPKMGLSESTSPL